MNPTIDTARAATAYSASAQGSTPKATKNQAISENASAKNKASVTKSQYGAVIGEPKLSEKAEKYYSALKKKFKDMDFVLVSKDMVGAAEKQASSYGKANRMVVLIDEEKLEKMASDKEYRKKYEGLIAQAQAKMPELQKLMSNIPNIKTIGMQVGKDNRASFFAVMDKSLRSAQEKNAAKLKEKKEAARKAEKKAEKKKQQEKLEKAQAKKASEADTAKAAESDDDYEIIMANSIEELMQKMEAWNQNHKMNHVKTSQETYVGQSIDFKA